MRCSSCLLRSPEGKPCPSLSALLPLEALEQRPSSAASPPRVWFKNLRDNSLIFVITGVEAGDRAPSCCSGPEWACWPIVGGDRLPVVDTWTSRRLFTVAAARPPSVPCLSRADPQAVPRRRTPEYRDRHGGAARWPHSRRSGASARGWGAAPVTGGDGGPVTSRDPAGTGSPQPVHIPGDNFSTSRWWLPAGDRFPPPPIRASPGSTSVHGCGQTPGQLLRRPPDDTAARCRPWLRRAASSCLRGTLRAPLGRTAAPTAGRGS